MQKLEKIRETFRRGEHAEAITECMAIIESTPGNAEALRLCSIMNGMVGNPGELTNRFNPLYSQFFKLGQISKPSGIFVFLDEQADTLNDGFFINALEDGFWGNVPGSYHNGAVNLTFADGHLETHRWQVPGTCRPVLKRRIDRFRADPVTDFEWLKERTSVKK